MRSSFVCQSSQGLLELPWTVYLEGKLQYCLKCRNFNKDKSVMTYHARKSPKICTCCRVREVEFSLYQFHSTKTAKAGPGFDEIP